MIARNLKNKSDKISVSVYYGFLILSILAIIGSVLTYNILPALIPVAIIGLFITITELRFIYFILISCLAISTEIELPGGFGTDLPGEPLMLLITAAYFVLILYYPKKILIPIKSSITILLLIHIIWIGITAITSENPIVSIKFLLAKTWYIVPFYFAVFLFLKSKKDIQLFLYFMLTAVFFGALFVMAKHASMGFSFDTIEKAVQPIYRNHVNYACLLVLTIPYLWFITYLKKNNHCHLFLLIGINLFILIAIYFSFTRAAILSVGIGIGAFIILRLKLTRIAFILSLIVSGYFVNDMINNNKYMEYAPNFEKTISHQNFDNLIEATAKGEDISTMERVYRWIAGVRMIAERPLVGYGPNNFYPYYKRKTVNAFETYVSDNPEKSGIHCYYLMIPVEQGIPGLIIFLLLCFYILYEGEKAYHYIKDPFYKYLVAAAFTSVIIILSILIVNDLLEADKVGPFFFIGAALIVLAKRKYKKELNNI